MIIDLAAVGNLYRVLGSNMPLGKQKSCNFYAASSSFAFASVLLVTSLPPRRRANSCKRARLSKGDI